MTDVLMPARDPLRAEPVVPAASLVLRIARAIIVSLVLIGLFAPLVASDRPFVLDVPAGASPPGGFGRLPEGKTYPWWEGLFNAREYDSFLDRYLNALMLLSPLGAALGIWVGRKRERRRRHALKLTGVMLVGAGAVAIWLQHDAPDLKYAQKIARLEAKGHEVRAVFPPIPYSPREPDVNVSTEPPSAAHWLGTDRSGRDVLARLLFGTRVSLSIGLVAVGIYVSIGLLLGALAGYLRGWVDALILRMIEVVSCFPSLVLILCLIVIVEDRSIFYVMLVIGVTGWSGVARLVRAEFLKMSELDYASAARALGLSRSRIVFRHLLPGSLPPVLIASAFGVAGAIVAESTLAFLGLGDAAAPSWGQVLREGRDTGQLHLILAPGLLIFVTVTTMNVVADGIRDLLDPKLRAT